MKTVRTIAPILAHFDLNKEILVETNASDYILVGVISQNNGNNVLHSVIFLSKKYTLVKYNFEIYDKKLIAIICYFEEWCIELESTLHSIQILSNYHNLE